MASMNDFKLLLQTTYMRELGSKTPRPFYYSNIYGKKLLNVRDIISFTSVNNGSSFIYVPKFGRMTFTSDGRSGSVTLDGETIISAAQFVWTDGSKFDGYNNLLEITSFEYINNEFLFDDWNGFDILCCMGERSFTILGAQVEEFTPQSQTCDAKMELYCSTRNTPECSCINNNSITYDIGSDKILLPVTCFNRSCYKDGYRTSAMSREVCTATQCEAVSSSATSTQDVYCAGSYYTSSTTGTNVTDDGDGSGDFKGTSDPTSYTQKVYVADTYVWIGSACILIVSLVLLWVYMRGNATKKNKPVGGGNVASPILA